MFVQTLTLAIVAACALQSTAESIYGIGSNTADFSTLVAAVNAAGLADALSGDGTLTLFAPPNSAFEKLPAELVTKLLDPIWKPQLEDLLKYHVLGSVVKSTDLFDGLTAATLNGENITINLNPPRINDISNILVDHGLVDIAAANGVIHGIDTVLTPTSVGSNIVDIAAGNDLFSTLVTAVTKAGLVDALSGEGPLTVFAPTNDAFAALPDGTLDRLLLPENVDELTKILQYHVVSANAHSSTLSNGDVETLSGDSITVAVSDAGVKINDATTVVTPDIIASNGIIHVIDTVLFPPDDTDESTTSGAMVYGTIVSALIVAAGTIAIA
mmetsp:Transcript_21423/g.39344  ORF Transcript_21423/g.39344 Transcript_21423/m.39344 type:complete len:328 (+) Transcript_21423:193-1176(+)